MLSFSDTDWPGGCHDDQEPDQGFDAFDQQTHEGDRRTARYRVDLNLYGPALVRHGIEAGGGKHRIYLRIAGTQRPQNHGKLSRQFRARGAGKECRNINEILIHYGFNFSKITERSDEILAQSFMEMITGVLEGLYILQKEKYQMKKKHMLNGVSLPIIELQLEISTL